MAAWNEATAEALERELIALTTKAREQATEDPFGSPILSVALAITRRLDRGEMTEAGMKALLARLGRSAAVGRAARLRAYVGLDGASEVQSFAAVAERLLAEAEQDRAVFAAAIDRLYFAAVFTAHPTFALPRNLVGLVAEAASEPRLSARHGLIEDALIESFRPDGLITLDDEFDQAKIAVRNGRDARDAFVRQVLEEARARWPDDWTALRPRLVAFASWVGCDTDGRTDIHWWDTLKFRLVSKASQLDRLIGALEPIVSAEAVVARARAARAAVEGQLALAPPIGSTPTLETVRAFALALVQGRDAAMTDAGILLDLIDAAIGREIDGEKKLQLAVARSGLATHGLAMAHPHFRLNAAQLHNAVRRAVANEADPADPAQRRSHLAAINGLLADVTPVEIDFGALAAERASAARLMMTVVQLLKHVDGSNPARFLIAETETGYTLLAALWLAERFGIADRIEITPLFETADALEHGARILDEALRSPHWQRYLRRIGRLVVQFGYSDSGRYVGPLPATFLVERLRLRIGELLARYDLTDIELVIFDTHGESIGRGGHPDSLGDRLAYLAPEQSRRAFAAAGLSLRHESSFQGTDGYLLFGTRALAGATLARIAEHMLPRPPASTLDPIYRESDFSAEFFTGIRQDVEALVEERGYARLLGTFGPNLLDRTGSRPAARQSDAGGPATITHPRQLRAIPNNAILQQLGWLANSLHGIGKQAARAPDLVDQMRAQSDRFNRAFRLAEGAARVSDLDVLRAYIDTLDPGVWLDRARRTKREGRRSELLAVAHALEPLDLAPDLRRLFRLVGRDWLLFKSVAPDLPSAPPGIALLHAIRLAIIHRIWFLAVHVPHFRPQAGISWEDLIGRILRLDVERSLAILETIFPIDPDPTLGLDFGETPGPREAETYRAVHEAVFRPMGRLFALMREVSAIIQIEIGAFG